MDKWWKRSIFYEIYISSFCDSNNDGIGDLRGITSKLGYLKSLGIDGIWLTPYYKSPKVDNGYDIEDYYEINPDYGTMDDFDELLREAHKRNIKIIADLVLNHTSDKHKWFVESKASKDSQKRDWYIWKDKPNNWESFFSGSAWEYDEPTKQYYYHAFAKEQVDLNWSNSQVKKAMLDVVKFWLDKGIDGFRLDVINFLKVNDSFADNPSDENGEQQHIYDKDQAGIIQVIQELRDVVEQYDDRFLVGEVGSDNIETIKEYIGDTCLDAAFNFNLGSIEKFDVKRIFTELKLMEEKLDGQLPTLFFSSHDMPRYISRFGGETMDEERAKCVAVLMLTARGIPFIYYGDEIGMRDYVAESIACMRDIQGVLAYEKAIGNGKSYSEALIIANQRCRDKSRSPMQWDASEYAGFSTAKPWMEVHISRSVINVENQLIDGNSIFNHYKQLISIREKHKSLLYGVYEKLDMQENAIYFVRKYESEEVLVIINFGISELEFSIEKYQGFKFVYSNIRESLDLSKSTIRVMSNESIIMTKEV